MSESCPLFVPDYLSNPEITHESYGVVKTYADGVRVIIEAVMVGSFLITPVSTETRYPDRALHYEHGYDENGNRLGHSRYIPNGIPEDAEV